MTAFARGELTGETGQLVCEIRSINHRYLETSVHLPESLRTFEMLIRDKIREFLKRGKIECSLRYKPKTNTDQLFSVNMHIVKELSAACDKITELLPKAALISPTEILRFPGVLETTEMDIKQLKAEISTLLNQTLAELVLARRREGEETKQYFIKRLALMQTELAKVEERFPQVIVATKDRLINRFQEAKIDLDPNRLEQEMLIFAQKIDLAEEIERTKTHIAEMHRVLEEGGMIGRRLDFLLQELNREANTLGSKSVDPILTHCAVELKVLIEQIREQVQNIE